MIVSGKKRKAEKAKKASKKKKKRRGDSDLSEPEPEEEPEEIALKQRTSSRKSRKEKVLITRFFFAKITSKFVLKKWFLWFFVNISKGCKIKIKHYPHLHILEKNQYDREMNLLSFDRDSD